jgi:hypothetical protein
MARWAERRGGLCPGFRSPAGSHLGSTLCLGLRRCCCLFYREVPGLPVASGVDSWIHLGRHREVQANVLFYDGIHGSAGFRPGLLDPPGSHPGVQANLLCRNNKSHRRVASGFAGFPKFWAVAGGLPGHAHQHTLCSRKEPRSWRVGRSAGFAQQSECLKPLLDRVSHTGFTHVEGAKCPPRRCERKINSCCFVRFTGPDVKPKIGLYTYFPNAPR